MPRGGARPNSGPKKGRMTGTFKRLTIGREAPVPDYRALVEMRQAALILRNLMVEAHNAYTGADTKDKKGLLPELREATKDYVRALREIVPYEDARLSAIAIVPPPPSRQPGDNAKVINLRIFEDTGTALGLMEAIDGQAEFTEMDGGRSGDDNDDG